MAHRIKSRWALGLIVVLLVAMAGVVAPLAKSQLLRGDDDFVDAAAPTATGSSDAARPAPVPMNGRQTVQVRRGSIQELLSLTGRVAAPSETALSPAAAGRVDTVSVNPGDVVEAGQVLLEADSKQVAKDLAAAREKASVSSLRLAQLDAQVSARQSAAAQRNDTEALRRQRAAAEAQAALNQAMAAYQRVAAGPDPADVRKAEQDVATARQALQQAEADQARVSRGPDAAAIASASRDQAVAEAKLQRAQADLARLTRGPDPAEQQAAERDVEQARQAVEAANNGRAAGTGNSPAERASRAAAQASAVTALQTAEDRLARLRQEPAAADVEAARRDVQLAQMDVDAARERAQTLRQGPDEQTVSAASAAVDRARLAVQQAEAHLSDVQAGPSTDQQALAASKVDSARLAVQQAEAHLSDVQAGPSTDQQALAASKVDSARLAVQQAEARLAEMKSHPTPEELSRAQDQVAIARTGLDQARGDGASADSASDSQSFDRVLAKMAVDQDQAEVQRLEQDLAATRLTAPFAGTVTAVRVRPGDPLDPNTPVITLAPPGTPIVRVDVTSDQAARLAVGQPATVQLDGVDGPLSATVADLVANPDTGARAAILDVQWTADPAAYNTSANIQVVLQEKSDVLLVPKTAVRTIGNRRTVELAQGSGRRAATVEVGITGDKDVEIVSGLQEGQVVLLKP